MSRPGPWRWQRPRWQVSDLEPRHLWTGAGLLLLFPYTDSLLDVGEALHVPDLLAYAAWIMLDCLIVALLFRSTGMWRAAAVFVAVTLLADVGLAFVYHFYYDAAVMDRGLYAWFTAGFAIVYVAIIATAMWWRLGKDMELFRYVVPVVFSIGVAFVVALIASEIACVDYHGPAPCAGDHEAAHVQNQFFQLASEVIPGLLIALAIEARIYTADGVGAAELAVRAAMFRVTVVAFAIGAGAALTVLATGDEQLPNFFQLTVQALALGFASIFVLLPVGRVADH